jgi:hypothetical protein
MDAKAVLEERYVHIYDGFQPYKNPLLLVSFNGACLNTTLFLPPFTLRQINPTRVVPVGPIPNIKPL